MNMIAPNRLNGASEEQSPLTNLVNFERKIVQVDIEKPIGVRLRHDQKAIRFDYNGDQFFGRIDRPLIHQLGSRLWPAEGEFEGVKAEWEKRSEGSPAELERDVADLFRQTDLQLRIFTGSKGRKIIYGVVSPSFVDVNQIAFRDAYTKQSAQVTAMNPKSLGIEVDDFGNIVEWFQYDSCGFQTGYRYGLVYAKNNGYDAYKVIWQRYVLVCSNGLRDWRSSKFRWKHTSEIQLQEFIANTIAEGKENQSHLEKLITRAQETELDPYLYEDLRNRLSLAEASKARIDNRLKLECDNVGQNEWALSQAFTWLGTHENALPYRMKPRFGDFGTDVLEKSLTSVLQERPLHSADGLYGLLVPHYKSGERVDDRPTALMK